MGETVSEQEAGGASAAGRVMLLLADDPGYTIDAAGGRQAYFPGREWDGVSRIEIATQARWSAQARSAKVGRAKAGSTPAGLRRPATETGYRCASRACGGRLASSPNTGSHHRALARTYF